MRIKQTAALVLSLAFAQLAHGKMPDKDTVTGQDRSLVSRFLLRLR